MLELKPSRTGKPRLNAGCSIKMTHQADYQKDGIKLLSMDQCIDASASSFPGKRETTYRRIADWIEAYPNSPHALLGHPGPVCPYTARAIRADTLRIGVCMLESGDYAKINALMRNCFGELKLIPCKRASVSLQTIIVGFPGCQDAKGIGTLKKVQRNLGLLSLMRAIMIACFYPGNELPGIRNPDFRPLIAPLPLIVVRHLVRNDAPFVARRPQLLAPYLIKFPVSGLQRLINHFYKHT
jgi:hypothetical protein